jgi:hypothetical protein
MNLARSALIKHNHCIATMLRGDMHMQRLAVTVNAVYCAGCAALGLYALIMGSWAVLISIVVLPASLLAGICWITIKRGSDGGIVYALLLFASLIFVLGGMAAVSIFSASEPFLLCVPGVTNALYVADAAARKKEISGPQAAEGIFPTLRKVGPASLGIALMNAYMVVMTGDILANSPPYLPDLIRDFSQIPNTKLLAAAGMFLRPLIALLCGYAAFTGRLSRVAGVVAALMLLRTVSMYITFVPGPAGLRWTWQAVLLLSIEIINFCWFCLFNIRRLYKSS